jgi:hypothetical protein
MQRRSFLTAGTSLGLAGVAMAAQTRVAQAATAATATIFDYGAVGDGVTDDSGAFNRALAAAASQGIMILVPGRNYALANPVSWTSQNHVGQPWGLMGQGATLVSKLSSGRDVVTLIANHVVRYMVFSGIKIQGTGSDGTGLRIAALSASVFFYNFLIDQVYVEGMGKDGLLFEGDVFEATVSNSYFQDNLRNGATFAHSKGGVCSAINVVNSFFNQNGQYGLCATNFDAQYGGATDVRVYGGYCRQNKSFGFYYNNGTMGSGIYQVGFENNCTSLTAGDQNGAHVYALTNIKMRDCAGYNEFGGATYLVRGYFVIPSLLDGCQQAAGGAVASTGASRLIQINGTSSGYVTMTNCAGGVAVVGGNQCKWQSTGSTGPSPVGNLSLSAATSA